MYKYTVEAYNKSDIGKLDVINIVVQANSEDDAIQRATKIKDRNTYAIIGIEELSREIKKG